MKHTLTFTVVTLFLITIIVFTPIVFSAVSRAVPVEEIQLQERSRYYFCICATSFGNLQAHLDCHEEEDRQKP